MKHFKSLLCILAITLCFAACSTTNQTEASFSDGSSVNPTETKATPSAIPQADACFMPICFDSEEGLANAVSEVKLKAEAVGRDQIVSVFSQTMEKADYSAVSDISNLTAITQWYKPKTLPSDLTFNKIVVKKEYVSYHYAGESGKIDATFTWFREMSPEVAMNELFGRGAVSEREIEHDGVRYVFLEWRDWNPEDPTGYTVHWVKDGRAYQASVSSLYSDEEILSFCDYETVTAQ